jgi:mycofactocin system FadH/OYE family oxidoreductase 2
MSGQLSSPLQVGPVTLANRIVFAAHLTNTAVDGLPTARSAAYAAARAAGGAGLVVTEESTVDPGDRPYEKLVDGTATAVVAGYRRVTDAVHAHGTPVFAQLNHNGGQSAGTYTRVPVRAPSPVADPLFGEVPAALTRAGIAGLVAAFAAAAERCAAGGFDGLELQASQSSLARGFLARATNRRTDGHGGPLEQRARFLLEVVAAVRAAIGPGLALGVRLSVDDGVAGGTTPDEAVRTAELLAGTGAVDYLSTAVGVAMQSLHRNVAPMGVPGGWTLPAAARIRAATGLPVVAVGGFVDPASAEAALAAGACDLVGIVRGQVADPEFAAKALGGRAAEIRSCLGCNQECIGRVGLNRRIGCVVNPRAGREAELPSPRRRPRRVAVVGGGPAGLQAAATAARRGHAVTLYEAAPRTGGQVLVAALAPGRSRFGRLVADLAAECARLGVDVRTSTPAGAALLHREAPDVVVLATGSRAHRPPWAGGHERVVDVRDVLGGRVQPAGEVLVVDDLGWAAAPSTAVLLAERGCAVEVTTSGLVVGADLGLTLDAERWHVRAAELGIVQTTDSVVTGVTGSDRPTVGLLHHPTGTARERRVDWVVVAAPAAPVDGLWHELAGGALEVHRIGDCMAPRKAHAATVEGERVAAAL